MKKRIVLLATGAAAAAFLVIRSRTKSASSADGTGQTPVAEPSAPVAAGVTEAPTGAAPAQAAPILDTPAPAATAESATAESAPTGDDPVVPVVEEVLHRHEGEDTPMVHAFEEAVAHEHGGATP